MNYTFWDFLQLFGSLGLFLFGMTVMSDALIKLAGSRMRKILATMTSNRVFGIATGFLITSVIQSSSATTLMVVSFANAGLLTLVESISVIMGANIGTTVTAWLITLLGFKVSMGAIALPLIGFGLVFTFFKKKKWNQIGLFIIGFSILFMGLDLMKDAVPNLQENPQILQFLAAYTDLGFGSVLIFLLIGTILTVVVQSSSATMALTLIMTAQGWIPFELAAAMVLGENIGTTITANLAAIVGNYNAKRTARAHLVFNLLGVIWVLILFYPFLGWVSSVAMKLGSGSPYVSAAAIPVSLSLFHTLFNISNTLLLAWFVNPIARLVKRLVPATESVETDIDQPKFLTKDALQYPETLVGVLKDESRYLFENAVFEICAHGLNLHREDILSKHKVKKVVRKSDADLGADVSKLYYTKVKNIYGQIINYATIGQATLDLSVEQHKEVAMIKVATRKMVEIIRFTEDINRNLKQFRGVDNENLAKEYDRFRKRIVKIWRSIYELRDLPESKAQTYDKLKHLGQQARVTSQRSGENIDRLIRDDLVTVDMASSLVNDSDAVNKIIERLITIAEMLYTDTDPILANGVVHETRVTTESN